MGRRHGRRAGKGRVGSIPAHGMEWSCWGKRLQSGGGEGVVGEERAGEKTSDPRLRRGGAWPRCQRLRLQKAAHAPHAMVWGSSVGTSML